MAHSQVFSIILSFILYAKPIQWLHIIGGLVFTASIVITIMLARSKAKRTAASTPVAVPLSDNDFDASCPGDSESAPLTGGSSASAKVQQQQQSPRQQHA